MKRTDEISIKSPSNPRIKAAAALHKKSGRSSTGLITVEGVREAVRAVRGGAVVTEIFYCPGSSDLEGPADLPGELAGAGATVYRVTRKVYEKLAYRKSTEGLIIVAERPAPGIPEPGPGDAPFYIAVDGVEKPGNLGAIFRTADGCGAAGVIVTGKGTDAYNPNVIRASIGTVFTVPFMEAPAGQAIAWLRERGASIIVSTPSSTTPYHRADMAGTCALVVGSEDLGASAEWIDAADVAVSIPMMGAADSLNVSVSASILSYEALRQRSQSDGGQG